MNRRMEGEEIRDIDGARVVVLVTTRVEAGRKQCYGIPSLGFCPP